MKLWISLFVLGLTSSSINATDLAESELFSKLEVYETAFDGEGFVVPEECAQIQPSKEQAMEVLLAVGRAKIEGMKMQREMAELHRGYVRVVMDPHGNVEEVHEINGHTMGLVHGMTELHLHTRTHILFGVLAPEQRGPAFVCFQKLDHLRRLGMLRKVCESLPDEG